MEFGQDRIGGFGPDEGFGTGIVLGEISIDCGLQVDERNTPRRMRCRVILEKTFSTAFSQEAEVGVK